LREIDFGPSHGRSDHANWHKSHASAGLAEGPVLANAAACPQLAEGVDAGSMRRLARELVDLQPDVILTDTTPVTAAALHETRIIPIVFVQVGDPVGSGFVASFPRPGDNATGFNNIPLTMAGKWLQLLTEVVPRTVQVMFLFNPPTAPYAQRLSPF
jgi:putative tryptophan/tyrosine transport system substrate-binding protein